MKNFLLWSLIALPINSALCMESQELIESTSPLYIAELRLLITKFLAKELSSREALNTIKAWALTDTKALAFFKEPEKARGFISWFNKFAYRNSLPILDLHNFSTLLDQGELAHFNQSLQTGAELVELFKTCGTQKEWSAFLSQGPHLEEAMASEYLAHYSWKGTYKDSYALRTLLSYALELQAPQEVITKLIEWGSPLTDLEENTPSPCCLVCQNIVDATSGLALQGKEQNAELDLCRHKLTLKNLHDTLTMLISKGASVNNPFLTGSSENPCIEQLKRAPLFIAAAGNNLELTEYLLEKGATCHQTILADIALEFLQPTRSLPLMESLFSRANSKDLQFLFRWLVTRALENPNEPQEYCYQLLRLLLAKKIDINALHEGITVLDMVNLAGGSDSKLAAFLSENGAHATDCKILEDLLFKTIDLLELKQARVGYIHALSLFLKEITTELLDTKKVIIPDNLIYQWLALALDVSSSQEGKEFYKFLALRFPEAPLFEHIVVITQNIKAHLNNEEAYQPILKQVQDLVYWFSKEGIKDTSELTGRFLAQELRMDELVECLTSVLPHF